MKKGFITIATGDIYYYKIAANLLLSYRHFSKNPMPFAIIAEEENEYTALFDDVIITNEAMHSFCDKFLLLKLCPYDETIFFDADCLAYGDLNEYWSLFDGATDFSSLGKNHSLDDEKNAWYDVKDIGIYGEKIKYKTRSHAGVCFIRKSDKLMKMYSDCMELFRNYGQLRFRAYSSSIDECIFGIAMPLNDMKATQEKPELFAAYPCLKSLSTSIFEGRFAHKTVWDTSSERCVLLHWGTKQTREPLYRFDVECLKILDEKYFNLY